MLCITFMNTLEKGQVPTGDIYTFLYLSFLRDVTNAKQNKPHDASSVQRWLRDGEIFVTIIIISSNIQVWGLSVRYSTLNFMAT